MFRHWYLKFRPNFATFFSNSTAHLQHECWRFHEPEKFSGKISERDLRSYGNAVKSGYLFHDRILGEVLDIAGRTGARVALVTAMARTSLDLTSHTLRHKIRADMAASAWLVVHRESLPQALSPFVRQNARQRIGCAARRKVTTIFTGLLGQAAVWPTQG